MGWCSGTDIFDSVCEELLSMEEISEDAKKRLLKSLVKSLEWHDWDCHYDSNFAANKIVQIVLAELHPDWDTL